MKIVSHHTPHGEALQNLMVKGMTHKESCFETLLHHISIVPVYFRTDHALISTLTCILLLNLLILPRLPGCPFLGCISVTKIIILPCQPL